MHEDLANIFIAAFPSLDDTGRHQARTLYQLLSRARPVAVSDFAAAIKLPVDSARQLLEHWTGVIINEKDEIEAFWGLTTSETSHRFLVDKQPLYTWCAWDLLFMPLVLNTTITAQTRCPVSGASIELTITPQGITQLSPTSAMITFIRPDPDEIKSNVTGSFCRYVFFTASEETGEQWKLKQPGGFLLKLEQGFDLGKKIIENVF